MSPAIEKTKIGDLTGQRFGKLVVIGISGQKKREKRKSWLCRCDCGKTIIALPFELVGGKITSCKCNQHKRKPFGDAAFHQLYRGYKRNGTLKNLEFSIPKEDFKRLVTSNCYYCGCKPARIYGTDAYNGKFTYNGLDRVDNSKGYTIDNVVPCCFECNQKKGYITIDMIEKINAFLVALKE